MSSCLEREENQLPTTGVVAGRQQDATSGLAYPDDMAGGRCAEDAVLADQELLDAVRSANLCD